MEENLTMDDLKEELEASLSRPAEAAEEEIEDPTWATLKSYLALSTGDAEEQKNKLRILRKARGRLLEEIHEKQQSLDQIDYIIGQTRKEQGGKGI